jgi:hypothetical protein
VPAASSATRAPRRRSPPSRPRRCCGACDPAGDDPRPRATRSRRRPADPLTGPGDRGTSARDRRGAGAPRPHPRPGRGAAARAEERAARPPRTAPGRPSRPASSGTSPPTTTPPGGPASPSATSSRWPSGGSTSPTARPARRPGVGGRRGGDVLLVDWRAPAAAAFYQATAADPLGVARRRTLVTRGREVRRPRRRGARRRRGRAARARGGDRAGRAARGARAGPAAAHARHRRDDPGRPGPHHPRAGERDAGRHRRAPGPARPSSRCTGSPTCSTATATASRAAACWWSDPSGLHRVHRPGAAGARGGPGRPAAAGGVRPAGDRRRRLGRPRRRRGQGRPRDGRGLPAAAGAALPPLPPETRVTFEGTTVTVPAADARARAATAARPGPSRPRRRDLPRPRPGARGRAAGALWRRGATRPPGRRRAGARRPAGHRVRRRARRAAQVTMLRRCFWPQLDAREVLAALATGERPARPRSPTGSCRRDDVALLRGAWAQATGVDDRRRRPARRAGARCSACAPAASAPTVRRTTDDGIRLAPETAARGGRAVGRRRGRRLPRLRARGGRRGAGPQPDAVAHAVAAAGPTPPGRWSATSRSAAGSPSRATWEGRRADRPARGDDRHLDVNYRTPAEIVEVARPCSRRRPRPEPAPRRRCARPGSAPPPRRTDDGRRDGQTVRSLGPRPRTARSGDRADGRRARAGLAAGGRRREDEDRVRVLDPRTAKGLEFDDVVVVAPDRHRGGRRGRHPPALRRRHPRDPLAHPRRRARGRRRSRAGRAARSRTTGDV